MLDALVFDFDGTILDTESCEFDSLVAVFEEFGQSLELSWFQTYVGTSEHPPWVAELASRADRPVDEAACLARRREIKYEMLEGLEPLPGVLSLLDEAAAAGLAVAVASSSPLEWVGTHLDTLGLRDRFVAIRTFDDVAEAKPAPDLYLAAIEALGANPARSVALEDSSHGITSAKTAGMAAVAIPNAITAGLDFSAADLIVPDLTHVPLARLVSLV